MTPAIVLISGLFSLLAVIGLIDLFVHLVCWSARSLRTPMALIEPRDEAAQGSAQGMIA
jgi:hypothetical protein